MVNNFNLKLKMRFKNPRIRIIAPVYFTLMRMLFFLVSTDAIMYIRKDKHFGHDPFLLL